VRPLFLSIIILNLLKSTAGNFDSLLIASAKHSNDSARVNLFYKEGFSHRGNDLQYSYLCARQAEKAAEACGKPFYVAKAANLLGILYYRNGDLHNAMLYHKKAMENWTRANYRKGIAVSQTNLGNIFTDLKNYSYAGNYYLSALQINNGLGVKKEVTSCLNNLGALNYEMKNYTAAKNYFSQAYDHAKKQNDYEMMATCLNNLADVNTMLGNYDDVIANCENSLKLKDLMENEMEKTDTYLTLALAYQKLNREEEFLNNIVLADSLIKKFDYSSAKIISLKLKADHYKQKKNYQLAFDLLNEHQVLKDSLLQMSGEENIQAAFFDPQQSVSENRTFSFPFVYLNVLVILGLGGSAFLFRLKR
jgi:tetratricopeptide (TPR) repeat protein